MATRMYVCESVEHPSTLLVGLNQQRLQGLLCDVTVRVQGHLFKAHTSVLASAMGYFRDLFLNQAKHKREGVIEIPMIVNSLGFAKVLDFIYTSQLCLSQSSVMQVLCSACFLQIPYVVEKCQEFIVTHGSVSLPGGLSIPDMSNNGQDYSKDNQELINTPPSPRQQQNHDNEDNDQNKFPLSNSEVSPQANGPFDLGSKSGHDEDFTSDNRNDVLNQAGDDHGNIASKALLTLSQHVGRLSEGQNTIKSLLKTEKLLNGDSDQIDHNSLAEYFSRNGTGSGVFNGTQFKTFTDKDVKGSTNNSIFNIQKDNGKTDQAITEGDMPPSAAHYLLAMKKEKPKKEYKCEYCSKMFGRQQHLKRHILTHTGERPYPCTLCDKKFRRSEHLKHHLVKHQTDGIIEPAQIQQLTGRKRQRKSTPVSASTRDAYEMSRLMLMSTTGQDNNPASPMNNDTNVTTTSHPFLPHSSSITSGKTINTISVKLAQANGVSTTQIFPVATSSNVTPEHKSEDSKSPHQTDPTDEAINLSNKPGTDSPTLLDTQINGERVKETLTEDTFSTADKTLNDIIMNHDDQQMDIDKMGDNRDAAQTMMSTFAGSEVMTSDLKNLFAAME